MPSETGTLAESVTELSKSLDVIAEPSKVDEPLVEQKSTSPKKPIESEDVVKASKKSKTKDAATKKSTKSKDAPKKASKTVESPTKNGNVADIQSPARNSLTKLEDSPIKPRKLKKKSLANFNRKITDYFQIRKSTRKCKSDLEKEKRMHIEDAILNMKEEGLEIRDIENKGRG